MNVRGLWPGTRGIEIGDVVVVADNLEELSVQELFSTARELGIVRVEGNTRESLIRQIRRMAL